MDPDFWHERWDNNQIGFHSAAVNPLLKKHFSVLGVGAGDRVFVPLCGKTLDIGWMLDQGISVVGVELSERAVRALFEDLGLTPDVQTVGALKRYSAAQIDIFAGDVFALTAEMVGAVQGVYDRAALIALPPEMRARYVQHVPKITGFARQLLLTFYYDPSEMQGPPFSVHPDEVRRLFDGNFDVVEVESFELEDGFRGRFAATDAVWCLSAK